MGIASDLVAAFWSRVATAFTAWAAPLAEHVTDTDPEVLARPICTSPATTSSTVTST